MVVRNSNRTTLLQGTACAAMATMLAFAPEMAAAQAFQATPVVVDGNATIDRSVVGQDTITAETDTVVIDWQPILGQQGEALTFLPTEATAIFQDLPGAGGFVVLNRILPTEGGDITVFNGTVISRLQGVSGGFSSGGTVAFYSPTGILVGPSAVFDVGSLLLTTLDPDLDSFVEFASGGALDMIGTGGQTTGITIQPGAQIISSGEDNFFAVVAPFIDMGGTATINGTTAYVAGEQVSMTLSNGLFDIVVPVGTSVANAVTHTGTTSGPASTGPGDNHVIYVVARSQQTPIQMLLGGNLGFEPAQTAGMDNGDIILSAGRNVFGRTVDFAIPGGPADIVIDDAQLSSSLDAYATRDLIVSAQTGDISIAGDAFLRGDSRVLFQGFNGLNANVDGDLDMAAGNTPTPGGSTGGEVRLEAFDGATIDITGNVSLEDGSIVQSGDVTAGSSAIFTDGGTINIGGSANVDASTNIIGVESSPTSVTGGVAEIGAVNGGTITIAGTANVLSYGDPISSNGTVEARGGVSEIFSGAGSLVDIGGTITLDASASAGANLDPGNTEVGASAFGGLARMGAVEGGEITINGDVFLNATASGGNGQGGGDAIGGTAGVIAVAGDILITGSITGLATAFGGNSDTGVGGDGGDATGGQVFVQADGSLTETATLTAGNVDLDNSGNGGAGGDGDGSTAAGNGGNGAGGLFDGETGGAFVLAGADRGTLILGDIILNSNGFGGQGGNGGQGQAGGDGGDGSGGTTQFGTFLGGGDGSVGLGSATLGDATARSDGVGGAGGSGGTTDDLAGNGGAGTGGATFLSARLNSLVTAGSTDLSANAGGGAGNLGGQATGGVLTVDVTGAQVNLASLVGGVEAFGGFGTGPAGSGGDATGGEANISVTDGSIDITGPISVSSFASGGAGGVLGGIAAGGTSRLTAVGGSIFTAGGPATFTANAFGGEVSASDASAGDATGGEAVLTVDGATVNLTGGNVFAAHSTGGNGPNGGDATGGTARVNVNNGGTLNLTSGAQDPAQLVVSARATGGAGSTGDGGAATAGLGSLSVNGSTYNAGVTMIDADAFGGAAANGMAGAATAGEAELEISAGTVNAGGATRISATAIGGTGLTSGAVTGGNAEIVAESGTMNALDAITIAAVAAGSSGQVTGGFAESDLSGASVFSLTTLLIDSGAQAQTGSATAGTSELTILDESVVTADSVALAAVGAASGDEATASGGATLVLLGESVEQDSGGFTTFDFIPGEPGLETGGLTMTSNAIGGATNTAGEFLIQVDLGVVTVDDLSIDSVGSTGGATGRLSAIGGNIFITDNANVVATGDIEIIGLDGNVVGDPNPQQPTADLAFRSEGAIRIAGNGAGGSDPVPGGINLVGASITLASRELDIDANSGIGALSLSLESLDTENTAILGGNTEEIGYTLTEDEAERIEAAEIEFTAPRLSDASSGPPDVLIRDLDINGSQDGGASDVELFTSGVVRVEGVLAYTDAGPQDRLEIEAGERIEVVTPGGIGIVDSDGIITGELDLRSANIWVADAETIAQLQSNPDFAGRNDLLSGAATGSDDPLGYLRAGSMDLFVGETLYVRNTGTTAEPGGILVGEDGLRIFDASSGSGSSGGAIDVFAYGRQRNADGTFVTGEAFFDLVNFTSGSEVQSEYTDASAFNDCLVNGGDCGDGEEPPPEEPEEEVPPVNNPAVIEAPISTAADPVTATEEESDSQFGFDFPGLVGTPLLSDETMLDDPVASGGDSSLYGFGAGEDEEGNEDDDEGEGDDDETVEDGE